MGKISKLEYIWLDGFEPTQSRLQKMQVMIIIGHGGGNILKDLTTHQKIV